MAIPSLRKEISEYTRATEALLACVLMPDSPPLSDDERQMIAYYVSEVRAKVLDLQEV